MKAFFRAHAHALTVFAAVCATAALIWLPIGHAMIGIIEEWDMVSLFHDNGVFFITSAHSPMPSLQIRPLNIAPQALAYVLGPNSFLTWHILLALSLVGKAIGMTVVARWLFNDRWIAVATGLLFMLYPADTMQMTLRAMHIDCSVALSVFGLALFLTATEAQRPWARWLLSILAGVVFVVGSLIYEDNLFIAPAPFLLWWARHGSFAEMKRRPVPILVWCFFVALNVAYIAVVIRHPGLYQQGLAQSSTPLPTLLAQRLPLLFTIGMYREFIDSWYDAARMLASKPAFWPYLGILAIILLGCLVFLTGRKKIIQRLSAIRVGRTMLVGLIIACLGYLPYLSSASHILITQRTHLVAAVGGAMAVAGLLQAFSSRPKVLSFVCWAVILSAALGAQWVQLDHYTRLSLRERMILAGIVQSAPDLQNGQHVVIIDRSGQLESTWMMRGEILMRALSYMYNYRVIPEVCAEPGLIWADFATDAQARPGLCFENASSWDIGVGVPGEINLSKQGLITLVVDPDGRVRRQGAPSSFTPGVAETKRWQEILGCWPASACRYEPPRAASYRYDWGTWWSLEEAPWGAGWRDTAWDPPAWKPRSYAWMNASQARLWVPLKPVNSPYQLRVRFYAWVSPAARDSLAISMNGKPLHIYSEADDTAIAMVSPANLVSGLNNLTFSAALDPSAGISGAMDWMELKPTSANGVSGKRDWAEPKPTAIPGGAPSGAVANGATAELGPNAVISFSDHGNAHAFMGAGWWRDADITYTWTEGVDSDLKMTLQHSATGDQLVFDVYPYLSKTVPVRSVQISINGRALDMWSFPEGGWLRRVVHVPPDLTGVPIVLHLHQSATPTPQELGNGADPRHVGLGVRAITVLNER